MAIHLDCHGQTDVGRQRELNEDQFLIADLNKSLRVHQTSLQIDDESRIFGGSHGKLLLVADGMGGHAAGDRASMLAIDATTTYVLNTLSWYYRLDDDNEDDFAEELRGALLHCQSMLVRDAEAAPQRRGMGTTLTMAFVVWPRLYVVHAGDSRCYVYRKPSLAQITRDHTIAEELVAAGEMSAEEAEDSALSHTLWNAIGGEGDELRPDVYKAALQVGDCILLCSDGLTGQLSDEEIRRELDRRQSAQETCRRLVAAANDAGGDDNITVVVARFEDALDNDRLAAEAEIPGTAEADETTTELDAPPEKERAEVVATVLK